ncbi:transmembrane 4 L6 family member 4-like [Nothobranchius furzeri]|uniref:Transmembrane 4 L6 family member 4-like n=1 Tax=Nothobranchius furzeri TaxID=105023 RepID=A0A9D3BG90_NOTFU|nr:transmembrane 4 L6 family member 4-like [Nothobranchius furzeri]
MCTGKCSLCIAISLYPLVLMSILCNALLFFPGWSMFFSIVFAAVGVAGAVYSFIVSLVGLSSGPLCFTDEGKCSDLSYVTNHATWTQCKEPKEVVQFNIGLFISLAVASVLQALLCAAQEVINGLFGCICGTCNKQVLNVV